MKKSRTSVEAGLENEQIYDQQSEYLNYLMIIAILDGLRYLDELKCVLATVIIACHYILRYFPPKGGGPLPFSKPVTAYKFQYSLWC